MMEHHLDLPIIQPGSYNQIGYSRDQINVPSIHRVRRRVVEPQTFPDEPSLQPGSPRPMPAEPARPPAYPSKMARRTIGVQKPPTDLVSPRENTLDRIGLTGLRENQMLHTLGDSELPRILDLGHWITFDRDEVVSYQGTPVNEVMFLGAGSARAEISAPAVREAMAVLNYLKPGDDIGLLSLVDGAPHSATVVALERLLVLSMSIEKVRSMLMDHPEWYRILAEVAVWRLRNSSVWLQSLM